MAATTLDSNKKRKQRERRLEMAEQHEVAQAQRAAEAPTDGKPVHVGDAEFDQAVLGSEVPVLVDFWAPWCGPCKAIAPVIDQLAASRAGSLKVVKYNTEKGSRVASTYGIRSIPTLMLFKDGQVVDTQVGAVTGARLEAWVDKAFGPKRGLLDRLLGRSGE